MATLHPSMFISLCVFSRSPFSSILSTFNSRHGIKTPYTEEYFFYKNLSQPLTRHSCIDTILLTKGTLLSLEYTYILLPLFPPFARTSVIVIDQTASALDQVRRLAQCACFYVPGNLVCEFLTSKIPKVGKSFSVLSTSSLFSPSILFLQ